MDILVIPLVAILMPLFLVPTIMTLKFRQSRKEWEHLERMKAMELGLRMPPDQIPAATKSIAWIGAGVPIFTVCAALLACVDGPTSIDGVPLAAIVWGGAVVISGGAMVTSLLVAFAVARPRKPADSATFTSKSKPVFDPDTFDVVASRG